MKLRCYTLFDITQTGVLNRNKPVSGLVNDVWIHQRNTQCNLDTILQVISLRSQPELDSVPVKSKLDIKKSKLFGYVIANEIEKSNYWWFDFTVQHNSVFSNGIHNLGHLYSDCHNVPMIKCNTEFERLPSFLDASEEMRNIYFEVLTND